MFRKPSVNHSARCQAVLRAVKRLGPRATNRQIANFAEIPVVTVSIYLRILREEWAIRVRGGRRHRRITVCKRALIGCEGSPLPWRTRAEMGLPPSPKDKADQGREG